MFKELKKLIEAKNKVYLQLISEQVETDSEQKQKEFAFAKWQLIKDYKTAIEQFVYDHLEEFTKESIEILDLVPNVVYRQLQEKTQIIINQIHKKEE